MQVCYGNDCPKPLGDAEKSVVTIGMFDGVHLGHQKVIKETIRLSRELQAPAIALTFDIHPRTLLSSPPPMICSLQHRLYLLEELGIDAIWVLSFTPELAGISADAFAKDFLSERLHANCLLMGENGSFGYKGKGTIDYVNAQCLLPQAIKISPVMQKGQAVSSTAIRKSVINGDLATAQMMLGRASSVMGTVMPGKQLGRTIGFPTLNIDPHHELHPPRGVYATTARCGSTIWPSITNIGHRPTVEHLGSEDILIETHLFGYKGNLYNQTVEVFFHQKIRDEKRFNSLEELKKQIILDTRYAREVLSNF